QIRGFIANPACERGTAKLQYLFVNGRWIRDRSLGHALQEAYRGLIMTGRYCTAFLFLELPPDQVDVNVHPTKTEVRFRDAQALWHFVFATVRNRLSAENFTARLRVTSTLAPSGVPAGNGGAWLAPQPVQATPSLFAAPGLPDVSFAPPQNGSDAAKAERAARAPTSDAEPPAGPNLQQAGPAISPRPVAEARDAFKAIQLYNTYLVLETPEGMLVIDQHALHERIMFEQLKERIRAGTLETQRLLIPEPVELTTEQAARTLEHKAALAELGLGVEDFGGGTLLLTSYPALLARRKPADILKNVVDALMAKDRLPTREVLLNDLLSRMACHAAVRAGDVLTQEEIAALVAQRRTTDDTHHCPHGRPTALLFSRHDLERQFRRI